MAFRALAILGRWHRRGLGGNDETAVTAKRQDLSSFDSTGCREQCVGHTTQEICLLGYLYPIVNSALDFLFHTTKPHVPAAL